MKDSYQVIAVFANTGISKASGNSFEMQRVTVLTPREDADTKTFQSHGIGLSALELSVSPAFYTVLHNQFLKDFNGSPVTYGLETQLDREGRNRVVGFASAVGNSDASRLPINTVVHPVAPPDEPDLPVDSVTVSTTVSKPADKKLFGGNG